MDSEEPVAFAELPAAKRVFAAACGEERPTLEAFLDLYRDVVVRKVYGVSEHDARRRLVSSATTLAGLVKHLRIVEMNWFQRILERTPEGQLPVTLDWDEPDSSFLLEEADTLDGMVVAYPHQCDLSRAIARNHQLGDTVPHPELGTANLRWIYIHMIDETARHAGHADILREQIDRRTGS